MKKRFDNVIGLGMLVIVALMLTFGCAKNDLKNPEPTQTQDQELFTKSELLDDLDEAMSYCVRSIRIFELSIGQRTSSLPGEHLAKDVKTKNLRELLVHYKRLETLLKNDRVRIVNATSTSEANQIYWQLDSQLEEAMKNIDDLLDMLYYPKSTSTTMS
jgi:hypothetical protein